MVDVDSNISNSYEEARKQRLEENKKRFQDLGISSISKDLVDLTNSQKKPQQQRLLKPKAYNIYEVEPRRSSRERNPVSSYHDDLAIDFPSPRKRRQTSSSWTSYLARPLEEVRMATFKQKANALKAAEVIQSNLQSGNPSFIKSMVRSHVYSCFWLGLPSKFCEEHLPKTVLDVVLKDENGSEYNATYIGKRVGLSGGWRAFALDHKLDDGDALVFELIEPTTFQVYIVKASSPTDPKSDKDILDNKAGTKNITKKAKLDSQVDRKKKLKKPVVSERDDLSSPEKLEAEKEEHTEEEMTAEKNGFTSPSRNLRKKGATVNPIKSEKTEIAEDEEKCVSRRSKRLALVLCKKSQ